MAEIGLLLQDRVVSGLFLKTKERSDARDRQGCGTVTEPLRL